MPVAITVGSVTPPGGTTVTGWSVTATPAGGDPADAIELASGTGMPPSTVATLDPSVLDNGVWVVTVAVFDSGGGTGTASTVVVVDGQLKLGRYSTSFLDLDVPIGGVPVRVVRTYDTLDRGEVGDFGYGWTLDVAEFQVQANRPLGQGGWEQYGCGSGFIFVPLCYRTTTRRTS